MRLYLQEVRIYFRYRTLPSLSAQFEKKSLEKRSGTIGSCILFDEKQRHF